MLLDTDVWSLLFLPGKATDSRVSEWRSSLIGATVVIATQTRAEVQAGIVMSNWGEQRRHEAHRQLNSTATILVDEPVIHAYAHLTADCKRTGHGLHDKQHTGDRWIAASALAWDLPLLSGDGIFAGTPSLRLMPEGSP